MKDIVLPLLAGMGCGVLSAWGVGGGTLLLLVMTLFFGVDQAAAKELGLRVLQAPGLPGRTAPVTAAAAIRDAVYHILWELEA